MNVQIDIPRTDTAGRTFLTWTMVQAKARLTGTSGAGNVAVTLRDKGPVGHVQFAATRTHSGNSSLVLNLPKSGAAVSFWIGGKFQSPSRNYGDAKVDATDAAGTVLGSRTMMIRVRKNALSLDAGERTRFLAALATLNGAGLGRFRDIRAMHTDQSDAEMHGNVGFLPWHRAYLLDLERELQAIDATVALPYWRFDQPAPALFTNQYMGVSDAIGRVHFVAGHPLGNWTTDNVLGISRTPGFNTNNAPSLRSEAQTLALGGAGGAYSGFIAMQGNPHGWAHTSFSGSIQLPGTAAKDPLFFLLHTNIDRLWAKWQWTYNRMDAANANSYAPASPNRIGQRLPDSMWPWNGITGSPRPPTAPGGTLAPSPLTAAPGPSPLVRQMLDYQSAAGGPDLCFAYDDVPFQI